MFSLPGSKWARPDITYKISAYPRGVSREEADNEVYSALKVGGGGGGREGGEGTGRGVSREEADNEVYSALKVGGGGGGRERGEG